MLTASQFCAASVPEPPEHEPLSFWPSKKSLPQPPEMVFPTMGGPLDAKEVADLADTHGP